MSDDIRTLIEQRLQIGSRASAEYTSDEVLLRQAWHALARADRVTEGTGTFDSKGNAVVGNIAIPASHVPAFRALLGADRVTVTPDRDDIAEVIFDYNSKALGSNVTFFYATTRMKRTAYEYADALLASGLLGAQPVTVTPDRDALLKIIEDAVPRLLLDRTDDAWDVADAVADALLASGVLGNPTEGDEA